MLAVHETPQKHKGRCINSIQRPQTWCGEGDLNPHEIAPASTSMNLTRFCGMPSAFLVYSYGDSSIPVFPRLWRTPLQNRCRDWRSEAGGCVFARGLGDIVSVPRRAGWIGPFDAVFPSRLPAQILRYAACA